MDNLSFVLWMLLWPIAAMSQRWIRIKLLDESFDKTTILVSDILYVIMWFVIGYLLYV